MAEILHFEILRKHGQTNTQTHKHTNKQTNKHTNRHGHYNTSPSPYGGRGKVKICQFPSMERSHAYTPACQI